MNRLESSLLLLGDCGSLHLRDRVELVILLLREKALVTQAFVAHKEPHLERVDLGEHLGGRLRLSRASCAGSKHAAV